MHAILDLKADGAVAENDEALEERLGEACASRFLVHDDWAELLVVADEDDLLAAQDERDHAL